MSDFTHQLLKEVKTMAREGIHPTCEKTTITCHCGNVIEVLSTKKDIKVEICSKCHPFFTGRQRGQAKGGRIERFKQRYSKD